MSRHLFVGQKLKELQAMSRFSSNNPRKTCYILTQIIKMTTFIFNVVLEANCCISDQIWEVKLGVHTRISSYYRIKDALFSSILVKALHRLMYLCKEYME